MTIRDLASQPINAVRSSPVRSQQSVTVQTSKPVSNTQTNEVSRTNSDSLQFLNQYKSKMDSLASAADKIRSLSKNGVWSNLEISSSDEGVVSNATTYGKIPQRAQYDIDVKQLAQRQISSIAALNTDFQDGDSFSIQSTDDNGNPITASFQIDTKGRTASQEDIMKDIIGQINQTEGLGVEASLVEKDGNSVIQLKGTEPGKKQSFKVDGVGIRSETTQEAQNLVYTMNGNTYEESSSHNIQIDPSGANKNLRLNFDKVGKATVTADVDTEKLARYTEQFVETYNKTIDFLVDNAHRGSGVSKTLDRLMQSPISEDAMSSIGLSFGRDGKITFESEDFEKAMQKDTRMVYDILADNYSVADTVYQKSDKAANNSAASLLDNSTLQSNNNGGIFIINNYNFFSPSLYSYPAFLYPGPLFFNAKA